MNIRRQTPQEVIGKENRIDSLGSPSLELIDPTPDVFSLFAQFNREYFWGRLASVSVRWSKRMYSCAGICRYRGREGFCEIALSEPLLKLRSRKNLVETLLHEMIHAYLFVTHNVTDRDGHGPNFHEHMYRINKAANINITVFHNFTDEVSLYKTHWWRCNGPCRDRKPFFGTVRRSSNRAPGPNDFWWSQHQQNCNGIFIKIKEPEKKQPKKKDDLPKGKNDLKKNNKDIRKFFTPPKREKSQSPDNESEPLPKKIKLNTVKKEKNLEILTDDSEQLAIPSTSKSNVLNAVRNHWANKYNEPSSVIEPNKNNFCPISNKRLSDYNKIIQDIYGENVSLKPEDFKDPNEITFSECPLCSTSVFTSELYDHLANCAESSILDDEQDLQNSVSEIVDLTGPPKLNNNTVCCPVCDKEIDQSFIEDHVDECLKTKKNDDDVASETDHKTFIKNESICLSENNDDEYDKKNLNDSVKRYPCPCCLILIDENLMNEHLDSCVS